MSFSATAPHARTGRGVCKSSAKNAMRVARTETNMAYRAADHERWQQLPFVLGQKVQTSHNHPEPDMCDDLKGIYPKEFKFTGWHPQCFCFVTPVLPGHGEMLQWARDVMDGKAEADAFSGKQVTEMPKGFTEWVRDNSDRIERAKSLPYFITDNAGLIQPSTDFSPGNGEIRGALTRIADRIKSDINHRNLVEDAAAEQATTMFTAEQIKNHAAVSEAIGIKQGRRKTFAEADSGNANPNFSWLDSLLGRRTPYNTNCTLTVGVHELRMRGWNVTALPYNAKNKLMKEMAMGNTNVLWIDPKTGEEPKRKLVSAKTRDKTLQRLEKQTAAVGRYHVSAYWNDGDGHILCVDRLPDGKLRIYDPQSNELNIMSWLSDIKLKEGLRVTRVDNLLINTKAVTQILKKR